jgi:hypothetical protein
MTELAPRGPRDRAGLAVSLLLHAAFVTAAILSVPWRSPPSEPRSLVVTLAPPLQPTVPRRRPEPPARIPPRAAASLPPPAAPAPATVPPIALPQGAPSTQAQPEVGPKVQALLRGSVGCAEIKLLHLSQEEQDRCAKLLKAHVNPDLVVEAPIAPQKRAWFDATVAARNAPDHGPSGVCFGKPPHGIKLGPLPCYIELPKGPLSEDVDVPPAPEH